MQTYTITTTIESASGTTVETIPGLLAGDLELIKEAARVTANQGNTVTHRVVAE